MTQLISREDKLNGYLHLLFMLSCLLFKCVKMQKVFQWAKYIPLNTDGGIQKRKSLVDLNEYSRLIAIECIQISTFPIGFLSIRFVLFRFVFCWFAWNGKIETWTNMQLWLFNAQTVYFYIYICFDIRLPRNR